MLQYWFMFPLGIIVATLAMILGVGGALFFSPIFILLFPIIGVDTLSPADAFGAALITELFGFSSGLIGYYRKKLIDFRIVKRFIILGIPLAIAGTIIKRTVSGPLIMLVFASGLWMLAVYTYTNIGKEELDVENLSGEVHSLIDSNGEEYTYKVCNQISGQALVGVGSFVTGLISVGVGETTSTTLKLKCNVPMKVASGTSVVVVSIVVMASAVTDIFMVGVEAIPWTLVMFTIPGVIIGGQIGPLLASRINPELVEKILIIIFFFIGLLIFIDFVL